MKGNKFRLVSSDKPQPQQLKLDFPTGRFKAPAEVEGNRIIDVNSYLQRKRELEYDTKINHLVAHLKKG